MHKKRAYYTADENKHHNDLTSLLIVSVANSNHFPCDVVKILGSDGILHFLLRKALKKCFGSVSPFTFPYSPLADSWYSLYQLIKLVIPSSIVVERL